MTELLNHIGKLMCAGAVVVTMQSCDKNDNTSDDNHRTPEYSLPARNPWLAQEHYSLTHFNSAQTDVFPFAVKDGTTTVDLKKAPGYASGPINLVTLASPDPNYIWGMSTDRVTYINIAGGGFEKVAECPLPGMTPRTVEEIDRLTAPYTSYNECEKVAKSILGPVPQTIMMSGNYVMCDKDNYAYANAVTTLLRFKLKNAANPKEGIEIDASLDMTPWINGSFTLMAVSMTYDGYLVVAGRRTICIVDRTLTNVIDTYDFPADQDLSNSICVDDKNGIYVATNNIKDSGKGLMQKIVWTGTKLSGDEADGAWQASYDGGPMAPAIKMGYGTGSTPTLMGFGDDEDKLVVITDGAKQMKIVAFWRDEIPADSKPADPSNPRIADSRTVTCGLNGAEWVQSEQSVVCAGYGAFVVNNVRRMEETINDKIPGVLSVGPILEPAYGVERLQWDTANNRWETLWTRADINSPSMIPCMSTASGMVFVNSYNKGTGWEITGLDWESGATRHRVIFGDTNLGNGAHAIIQYLPDGDLLFNSVYGPRRIRL